MFDNNQKSSLSVNNPQQNRIECRDCKTLMITLGKHLESYVCPYCGNTLIIDVKEHTIWHGWEGREILKPVKVIWGKVKVEIKEESD